MPVVINEIVFKATVADPAARGTERQEPPDRRAVDTEALVALCVEEVLRILERQKDR
jgi:uncharacterized protein DUF5908